jgi:hypothetical protein
MSQLNRMPWQLHVMRDPESPNKIQVVTNNFKLSDLELEDLPFAVSPFIGVPGKLEIQIYDNIGTEEERKALFDHISDLFDKQRRAVGFLTPVHSALHTYWYNVSSKREKYDIRGLKNVLNGIPVLYCGAGPSLKENIDAIRHICEHNKAFVITGGTGIKILSDHGITPHLCLAVDPFMQECERFDGVGEDWQSKVPLLGSASLNPLCYEGWKGKLIAAEGINCMPTTEYIEGEDAVQLDEGPVGVTTWMLNVLEYMGAKDLHLIGTDLCYGKSGETYAFDYDMTANQSITVEDYQGRTTRANWIFEAKYIGRVAAEKGYNVYNCSGGLEIPGAHLSTLDKLVKAKKKYSPKIKYKKWMKAKYTTISIQLRKFAEALRDLEDNLGIDEVQDHIGYKYLIKPYDDIQEYQYWRTGMYNYSLIREVCRKNAELIEAILNGKTYDGELPYGHLGSPQTPEEKQKKKVRTGSRR